MKLLISNIILLLAFAQVSFANTFPVKKDFEKIIEKSFPINANGTFDVTNKYGSITIKNWDKKEVEIKVFISVRASSESKANDVFDRIEVNFRNDPGYVMAATEIESQNSSWFSWGNSDSDFQINYEVKMPKTVHLKASNKYGNMYLSDLENGAELEAKYGDIRSTLIVGEVGLDLGYGKTYFDKWGNLNANVKYSEIEGNTLGDAKIDSKYSKFSFNNIGHLKCDTGYDDYKIDKAISIENEGKYDNFDIDEITDVSIENRNNNVKIDELHGKLEIDQKYGSIDIDDIDCNNAGIDIDGEYIDIDLGLGSCNNYDVDIKCEYSNLDLPNSLDNEIRKDGHNDKSVNAKAGNGSKEIRIRARYGSIKWN